MFQREDTTEKKFRCTVRMMWQMFQREDTTEKKFRCTVRMMWPHNETAGRVGSLTQFICTIEETNEIKLAV
jgi:uncharacterized protein (UPF0332 family)